MSSKMGRPVEGEPKDFRLQLRVDKTTTEKLDKCVEKLHLTRSDVVRMGIDEIYKQATEKK